MNKSITAIVCCFALSIASVAWAAVYVAEKVSHRPEVKTKRTAIFYYERVIYDKNPHRVTVKLKDETTLSGWALKPEHESEIVINHDDDSFSIVSLEDVIYLQIHPKPPTLGDLS